MRFVIFVVSDGAWLMQDMSSYRKDKETSGKIEEAIPRPAPNGQSWLCLDLPLLAYQEAWELQSRLVAARKEALLEADVFLLLEHPPVFTLGRRGGLENLRVTEGFLEQSGIPLFHVERGGNITFHGPGQLVGYGIVALQGAGLGVVDNVTGLEEVMIRTAAEWAVAGGRPRRWRLRDGTRRGHDSDCGRVGCGGGAQSPQPGSLGGTPQTGEYRHCGSSRDNLSRLRLQCHDCAGPVRLDQPMRAHRGRSHLSCL